MPPHPDGLATFRNFLKSEYSDENIEFWLTCEDFKKVKSSFRMSSRAKKIYEQFIKAESPKEVSGRGKGFRVDMRKLANALQMCA